MASNTVPFGTKPKVLFHYTTQSGLLGIISKKTIWATDLYYMSDAMEFRWAIELIRRQIMSHLGDLEDSSLVTLVKEINKTLDWIEGIHMFVCSFSEEDDLLSQWRAYCPNGNGFSIGFDYSHLVKRSVSQGFQLKKCHYDEVLQSTVVSAILGEILDSVLKELEGTADRSSRLQHIANQKARESIPPIISLVAIFKHPSFKEENEWRLVSEETTLSDPNVQYREGKSMVLPYLQFGLAGDDGKLGIKEIIVGPTPHQELSKQSVLHLLSSNGIESCEVKISGTPYQTW